jgi:TPP-dependent pyruvate/acetoin dehydrogenase alpha subunit
VTTADVQLDRPQLAGADLVEWLEAMLVIRTFEQTAEDLSIRGKIPGGIHPSIGQEAVAVGAVRALAPDDIVSGGHRSHHHALAKGLDPALVMAELFGRSTGVVGGRGGSMHLAAFDLGHFGSNGIVGAGVGVALGAAMAAQMRETGQVAVGFIGDGGANTGRTWEFVNMAAIWRLPLIVVCENNLYAVETHVDRVTAGGDIAERASGFGLPALKIDGQDVTAVYAAVGDARSRAAAGEGPTFIEALTYRYLGHNTGEVATYRTADEIEEWRTSKDPIDRFRAALQDAGLLDNAGYEQAAASAKKTVDDAVAFADQSPWPEPGKAGA